MPVKSGSENDMRFIYCACCISYILDDWTGIDQEKVTNYIKKSLVSYQVFLPVCLVTLSSRTLPVDCPDVQVT